MVLPALTVKPWTPDLARAFVPSVEANPWGPLENLLDVLGGAFLFEFRQGGAHALAAARPVACANGRRLDVVGLVSAGDRLTAEHVRGLSLAMAARLECDMLAMTTMRPHLARTCVRAGWAETGQLLTMDARALQ